MSTAMSCTCKVKTLFTYFVISSFFGKSFGVNLGMIPDFPDNWGGDSGEEIVVSQDGEPCLRANLQMEILLFTNTTKNKSLRNDRMIIHVRSNKTDGVCEGQKNLGGINVTGPAVAFFWEGGYTLHTDSSKEDGQNKVISNGLEKKEDSSEDGSNNKPKDMVIIQWAKNDDTYFIHTIWANLSLTHYGFGDASVRHRLYEWKDLMLFPSSPGSERKVNKEKVELAGKGEFIFDGGSFEIGFEQTSYELEIIISVVCCVGIIIGIIFYIKGRRMNTDPQIELQA